MCVPQYCRIQSCIVDGRSLKENPKLWEEIHKRQSWTAKHSLPCISEVGVDAGHIFWLKLFTCMSCRPFGKTTLLEPGIAWNDLNSSQSFGQHLGFRSCISCLIWHKVEILSRINVDQLSNCYFVQLVGMLQCWHASMLTKCPIVTLCNWLACSSGTRSSSSQWRIWNRDSHSELTSAFVWHVQGIKDHV